MTLQQPTYIWQGAKAWMMEKNNYAHRFDGHFYIEKEKQ
jgi:hypothetical protein